MRLLELITGPIIKEAMRLVDELHTSEAEKLEARSTMFEMQIALAERALQYEEENLEAKSRIIEAEARSESWITVSWRPITMMVMLCLVVGDALAWLPNPLSEDAFMLLQIGIGGYLGSRSVEKIVSSVRTPN